MRNKTNIPEIFNPDSGLKNITSQDFLNFGIQDIAYVKAVQIDNDRTFVIHAADGTPLSTSETQDSALVTIRQNDLEAVSIH